MSSGVVRAASGDNEQAALIFFVVDTTGKMAAYWNDVGGLASLRLCFLPVS